MTTYAPLPLSIRRRNACLHIALIAGFLLLALWFKLAMPYDNYFFVSSRVERLLHIIARITFAAYFFGILFGSGQWLLKGLTRHLEIFSLTACEEIAASVITGSAVIRICMLLLGFAGLYSFWLLLPMTVLALLGAGRLPQLLRLPQLALKAPLAARITRILLLTALFAAIGTMLGAKFLYPNGTADYFTHYFHYYQHVIKNAGTRPNDVWYHFYISKGAGDVFLAMILSDPLAPLAVSFVMYVTGIAIGYAFFKRMTQEVPGSLLASAMIAAPLPEVGLSQYWPEFSKQHIITAVLFFGIVWAVWLLEELPQKERPAWRNIIAAIIIGLIVLRPQFAVLCDLYLMPLAVIGAYRRSALMRTYVFLALVAAVTAIAMLALNYAITGLADVTPFRLFWEFADQERFSHWVSPFMMLLLEAGSSPEMGALSTPQFGDYQLLWLLRVLRLDLIAPYIFLLLPCAAVMVWSLWRKSLTLPSALLRGFFCLEAMLLATAITVFCNGPNISLFRMYIFCLYPVLMITAIPFALMPRICSGTPLLQNAAMAVIGIVPLLVFTDSAFERADTAEWNGVRFATGTSTIAQAYEEQNLLWKPGIMACGQVPPDTRIWASQSMNRLFESPHCRFETFFSYSMGPDYARILFDDADLAEAALKKQKLDYFLIDTGTAFFDIIPYSPLFSPGQIGRHFGVAWSQGGVYLLTWRSERTAPIPPEFFAGYRNSVEKAIVFADFPALYHTLSVVYRDWKRNPHWPVAIDPNAPHPRGWQ